MKDRLQVIVNRYNQISELLQDINIVSDIKKLTELSKEQRSLEKSVNKYHEMIELEANIQEAKELLHDNDPELKEMAKEEAKEEDEDIEDEIMTLDDVDLLKDEDFEAYGDFLDEEAEADEELLKRLGEQ